MKTSVSLITAGLLLAGCGASDQPAPEAAPGPVAFVQLFEWHWNDVAEECETVLGPAGYTAVQVSPPNEHITGPAWWTRYQPVSYLIESRSGTRAEFAAMVERCATAGVGIYADAVINHMAGFSDETGVAAALHLAYRLAQSGFSDKLAARVASAAALAQDTTQEGGSDTSGTKTGK